MTDKVLIIVGDASETLDTMYPYYRLQEAGFQPVVAAPEKRKYQMVLHEVKPGWTITKEWEGYTIQADVAFSEVNEEDYAGIMYPSHSFVIVQSGFTSCNTIWYLRFSSAATTG